MKTKWKHNELWIYSDDKSKYSYVALLRHDLNEDGSKDWWPIFVELEGHPLLQALESKVFDSELAAKRAMSKAFKITWIGATEDDREDVWD
ncbi:MAG: hypothetical protein ACKO0Z_01815 [Betaproteobacteria bacterium]